MLRLSHRLVGKVLATVALLGNLVVGGERFVPDDHDGHAAGMAVISMPDATPFRSPFPGPNHPVHVCHGDHQHIMAQPALASSLVASAGDVSSTGAFEARTPHSLPLQVLLRPPRV